MVKLHQLVFLAFAAALAAMPAHATPAQTAGPSFDCGKATGPIDRAICASPELSARDRTVAELFALVRVDALGVGPSGELAAQRTWLAQRDKDCAKAPDIAKCLAADYDQRLAELAVAALIRAPGPALTELRRQNRDQAGVYEAIRLMATTPDGPARTSAVARLIGPEFAKVAADQQDMLDSKTPAEAASSLKSFDSFLDLTGAVDDNAMTLSCEAIVKQPALVSALDSMFGSSMDNRLGGSDCDDMLPPPPKFADLASAAIRVAMSDPDCTGTLRFAGLRAYNEFLIVAQLNRQGKPDKLDPDVAKRSAAYKRAHSADVTAATTQLAAYYSSELHAPNAAQAASGAVGQVIDSAFEVCGDE